jgi:hypothetical protein
MRTESVAATDTTNKFMDMYMAAEVERNKQEALRTKDSRISTKTEQLNKFAEMLSSPNLPAESKAIISDLFASTTKELKSMTDAGEGAPTGGAAGGAASGAADGAAIGAAVKSGDGFTTPSPSTPEGPSGPSAGQHETGC